MRRPRAGDGAGACRRGKRHDPHPSGRVPSGLRSLGCGGGGSAAPAPGPVPAPAGPPNPPNRTNSPNCSPGWADRITKTATAHKMSWRSGPNPWAATRSPDCSTDAATATPRSPADARRYSGIWWGRCWPTPAARDARRGACRGGRRRSVRGVFRPDPTRPPKTGSPAAMRPTPTRCAGRRPACSTASWTAGPRPPSPTARSVPPPRLADRPRPTDGGLQRLSVNWPSVFGSLAGVQPFTGDAVPTDADTLTELSLARGDRGVVFRFRGPEDADGPAAETRVRPPGRPGKWRGAGWRSEFKVQSSKSKSVTMTQSTVPGVIPRRTVPTKRVAAHRPAAGARRRGGVPVPALFGHILGWAVDKGPTAIDAAILVALQDARTDSLTNALLHLSALGTRTVLIPIMVVIVAVLLLADRPRSAVLVAVSSAGVGLLNWAAKTYVSRPRPFQWVESMAIERADPAVTRTSASQRPCDGDHGDLPDAGDHRRALGPQPADRDFPDRRRRAAEPGGRLHPAVPGGSLSDRRAGGWIAGAAWALFCTSVFGWRILPDYPADRAGRSAAPPPPGAQPSAAGADPAGRTTHKIHDEFDRALRRVAGRPDAVGRRAADLGPAARRDLPEPAQWRRCGTGRSSWPATAWAARRRAKRWDGWRTCWTAC